MTIGLYARASEIRSPFESMRGLRVRRAAIAAGAAIVLLAYVLEQAKRLPVRAQGQLEVLRERPSENLGVIDRDLVAQRVAIARQAFDRVQLLAVPARLRRIGVVIVVENPALEVHGIDDERIALPFPHRVAVIRRLESLAVR